MIKAALHPDGENILEIEIWRPIVGYEEIYEISNCGRVKRLIGYRCRKERILKQGPLSRKCIYFQVDLSKDGQRKAHLVHRLVLETFVGVCPDGMECCHGDGNPHNNFVTNLRWDTHHNNMLDSVKHGTRWNCKGSLHPSHKLTDQQITEIISLLEFGVSHKKISQQFGVSRECITTINCGKRWGHITGGRKTRDYSANSKLSPKDISEILLLLGQGAKQKDLGEQFGVDPSQISRIKNKKAHIKRLNGCC